MRLRIMMQFSIKTCICVYLFVFANSLFFTPTSLAEPSSQKPESVLMIVKGNYYPHLKELLETIETKINQTNSHKLYWHPKLSPLLIGRLENNQIENIPELEKWQTAKEKLTNPNYKNEQILKIFAQQLQTPWIIQIEKTSDGSLSQIFYVEKEIHKKSELHLLDFTPANSEYQKGKIDFFLFQSMFEKKETTTDSVQKEFLKEQPQQTQGFPLAQKQPEVSKQENKTDEKSDSPVLDWLSDYWPYLVGGALLGGTIAFFVVDPDLSKTKHEDPQFHFRTAIPTNQ